MGLFVSLLGGAVVGFGHWLAIALFADPDFFSVAPPQYHVIFIGAIAGKKSPFVIKDFRKLKNRMLLVIVKPSDYK